MARPSSPFKGRALMFTTDAGVVIRLADEIACPRGHKNGVHAVVIEPRRVRFICQDCHHEFVTIEFPAAMVG
jgi:hypothetical protein